jgi:hypothetical protein
MIDWSIVKRELAGETENTGRKPCPIAGFHQKSNKLWPGIEPELPL